MSPHPNLGLLRTIAANLAFERAELDTGFIARHAGTLLPEATPKLSETEETAVWAAATLALLADQRAEGQAQAKLSGDPWSPCDVRMLGAR